MSDKAPTTDDKPAPHPLDALLLPLQAWVEAKEAEKAATPKQPDLPDDIPHFVTRYP